MAVLVCNSGAYTLVGAASTTAHAIDALTDLYEVTGTDATFILGRGLLAVSGVYTLTGTAIGSNRITAEPAGYLLNGQVANLVLGAPRILQAVAGSYSISGQVAFLSNTVTSDRGQYTITGTAATLTRSEAANEIIAEAGAYVITGSVTQVLQLNRLIDSGNYTITGTAATLRGGKGIVALTRAFVLGGQAATLKRGYRFNAETGSYVTSGNAANLNYQASNAKFVLAENGTYALVGTETTSPTARFIDAVSGSYAITGVDATFPRKLLAAIGAVTLVGTAADLRRTAKITAESGSYAINAPETHLRIPKLFSVDSGSYSIAGPTASTIWIHILEANGSSYTISATDVFLRSTHMDVDTGAYAIVGSPATLTSTRNRRWTKQQPKARAYTRQAPRPSSWDGQPDAPGV